MKNPQINKIPAEPTVPELNTPTVITPTSEYSLRDSKPLLAQIAFVSALCGIVFPLLMALTKYLFSTYGTDEWTSFGIKVLLIMSIPFMVIGYACWQIGTQLWSKNKYILAKILWTIGVITGVTEVGLVVAKVM